MKITLAKMWKDLYDYNRGECLNELNAKKFFGSLNSIFDEKTADEIYKYALELHTMISNSQEIIQISEKKKIGEYEVNAYITNRETNLFISKRI